MYLRMGKATIALILVMLMAFLVPVQAIAEVLPEAESPEQVTFGSSGEVITANIVSELESKRDETTKHFRMDDGTIMAVNYGTLVHYKNGKGEWVEYDNSLIVDENADNTATADEVTVDSYVNKKSNLDISLSSDSQKDEMINIGGKKGNISWKYADAKRSNAKVKNNNKKYTGNEKFTNIDKITSTAQYDNIYDNVDLECIVSPNGVKENIILENSKTQNEFEIEYKFKGLTAKQIDTQNIKLYDKNDKEVYTISAPYMYDAEGNVSEDVTLEIISNKNNKLTVKLVADKGFIKSWGRKFPVTIDPEVVFQGSTSTMTAQVCKNNPDTVQSQSTHFYVGTDSSGKEYSGLVQSSGIEDDFADKNIVSAKVKIYSMGGFSPMEIDAYPVTSAWTTNTVTYNNATHSNDVIDYVTTSVDTTGPAVFDITKTFKQWCNGELDNNGIYLKSDDYCTDFGGYYCYYSSCRPQFEVIYKEYNGSESNLTKHTVNTGQNAELSVVDFTGDLVVKQNLYSESGSRFPMDLYATYHSTENTLYDNIGYGWRMSYDKTLTLSNGYYIYEDADGVNTYFKAEENSTELYDEDELGYTLKINDSSITVDDGSVIYTFDVVAEGEISKIKSETDVDNSENAITYTYNSENLLTTINSTFGTYTINYTTSSTDSTKKWITNIVLPDSSRIYYVYYGGTNKIARIKLNNGLSSYFEYTSYADEGLLNGVCHRGTSNEYGPKITCTYNSNNQVTKITEYGYNTSTSTHVAGNYLNISYGNDNTTTFTDKKGRSETYTFDEYGNTISVLNANGYIENTGNSGLSVSGGSDSYTKNYIDVSSEPDAIGSGKFYQKVNGTIGSTTSSGGTTTVDTTTSYLGSKSIKINHSGNTQIFTSVRNISEIGNLAGKTVTFSAYVKLEDIVEGDKTGVTGAFLKIKCLNTSGTTVLDKNSVALTTSLADAEWQRISVTATIPDAENVVKYRIFVGLRNVQGSAYFDCLQLEEGSVMNDYNALSNSDFTTTDDWYNEDASAITLNSNGDVEIQGIGGESAESATEATSATEEVETYTKTVTETVGNDIVEETDAYGNVTKTMQGEVTRTYKRTYEVTEATESSSTTEDDGTTEEEIVANKYVYQTVPVGKANVSFNISGTANAKSVPLNNGYRTFGIAAKIKYKGDTTFTEEHYQEFNCATTVNQSVSLSVYPYEENKVISEVAFAFVYGYNKNVMTVKNAMLNFAYVYQTEAEDNTSSNTSTDTSVTYDGCIDEEVISESVDKTKEYMQSSSVYDTTGNLVKSQTDEAGNTTSYTYDGLGRQTSITDGKGNSTSYGYDSVGNLTSITNGQASNSYTYDNYSRLSAINHNSFAYNFNYDIYNQLIETKVGNQTLVSNTYESGNGNLLSTTYGNGDVISYTYDSFDRITKISNADGDIADFTYNKKGLVTKVYDYAIYQTINYQYDCHGSMVAEYAEIPANTENRDLGSILAYNVYTDGDGNTVEKTYINNRYKEIVRGTDDAGDEFVTNDGVTVTTEIDDFGRLASVDTNYSSDLDYNPFYYIYNYEEGSASNSTTNLVNQIEYTYGVDVDDSNEGDYHYVYEYEYDANNNITQVITGETVRNSDNELEIVKSVVAEYEYDSLNQLAVAKDVNADTYTEYTYDNAGNITTVKTYALNDNLTKGALQSTNTYSYDSVWKDKLASYTENGTTNNFTYDAIGNPINYRDGMVMSWENGRQLSSITTGNETATFKYNSDGMRTYKDADGEQTYYYYDSNNNLIALDKNSTIVYFYYDSNGSVTSMSMDETLYFFIKNQQGDVEKIVNRLGQIQVSYTYDAWGNVLSVDDNSFYNISRFNPFGYRGYVYDHETGLYYLQSRYYDPQTGRFLNADDTAYLGVTGTVLSCNLFTYCENDPVDFVDHSGMVKKKYSTSTYKNLNWLTKLVSACIPNVYTDEIDLKVLYDRSFLGVGVKISIGVAAQTNASKILGFLVSKNAREVTLSTPLSKRTSFCCSVGVTWTRFYVKFGIALSPTNSGLYYAASIQISVAYLTAVAIAACCVAQPYLSAFMSTALATATSSATAFARAIIPMSGKFVAMII